MGNEWAKAELSPVSPRYQSMKVFLSAIIAVVVLWFVDTNFNGGHYTIVIVRVIRPIASLIGIHI